MEVSGLELPTTSNSDQSIFHTVKLLELKVENSSNLSMTQLPTPGGITWMPVLSTHLVEEHLHLMIRVITAGKIQPTDMISSITFQLHGLTKWASSRSSKRSSSLSVECHACFIVPIRAVASSYLASQRKNGEQLELIERIILGRAVGAGEVIESCGCASFQSRFKPFVKIFTY